MFEEPEVPAPWEALLRAGPLHHFVADNGGWLWPLMETLHYLGLSLLFGTVLLFDLRVLGMAKAIPPAALHRLIPFGIAGFFVNLLTGILFFNGFPEQYFYNAAFQVKVTLLVIAGLNAAYFYLSPAYRQVKLVAANGDVPMRAKVIAGTSFAAWIGVLICGRLLTFFRPLFFH